MSEYLQYGGQAVIEGVMMRSPRFFAIACRKPDGEIVICDEAIEKSIMGRLKWLNRPFLRGTLALIDAMVLGMKALTFAANVQVEEEPPADAGSAPKPEDRKSSRINDIAIGGTMVSAFCVGTLLFVALPTKLTQLVQPLLGSPGPTVLNMTDGLIRIVIFLAYVAAIGCMANVRTIFEYHGAEHKVINTLESGGDLTVEGCLRSSRIHPRCGTSFIIIVLLAGIVVHSIFPRPPDYLTRVSLHLALIPLVAGASYETIRLAGRLRNSAILGVLLAPGLWTQRITTREPNERQVEVALASLKAVLVREGALGVEAPEAERIPA